MRITRELVEANIKNYNTRGKGTFKLYAKKHNGKYQLEFSIKGERYGVVQYYPTLTNIMNRVRGEKVRTYKESESQVITCFAMSR